MSVTDLRSKDTIRTFDRGTPAGRVLHNLYVKPSKPSTVDEQLMEKYHALRLRKDDLASNVPRPVPKSRAFVEKPMEFRREKSGPTPFAMPRPCRRGQNEIQKAIETESPQPKPMPKKPAMTDADKMKLQRFMEYDGEPPELPAPRPRRTASQGRPRSPRLELLDMFNAVAKEIAERREFLKAVAGGKGAEDYAHVTLEIAERVKDLKRIDTLIKAAERDE